MRFLPNHSAIIVSDALASSKFYEKALGFRVHIERKPSKTVRSIFMKHPDESFLLQILENGNFSREYTGYGHFSASVEDIYEAYRIHSDMGCVAGAIIDLGYQLCYFIRDDDGYETEIIQYINEG